METIETIINNCGLIEEGQGGVNGLRMFVVPPAKQTRYNRARKGTAMEILIDDPPPVHFNQNVPSDNACDVKI